MNRVQALWIVASALQTRASISSPDFSVFNATITTSNTPDPSFPGGYDHRNYWLGCGFAAQAKPVALA
jgi:hypothetical protein